MNRGLCILIQLIISIAMTAAAAAENADYGYLDEEDPQQAVVSYYQHQ